jgi:EAL domain-containing protein (putative c-di-GMP-specific phosphodiesterase class I)/GGDEF domain-containing protein/CBS domain-containing protein
MVTTMLNIENAEDIGIDYGRNPSLYYNVLKDKDLGDEFMGILQNGDIKTVFQPIISLKDGGLLGYEALSRGPANSVFNNPEKLFDFARLYGRLWELEFLCRIKALENMSRNNPSFCIFLNVDPHIIDDEKFKKGFTKDFLREFNINPENVVFEITEKNSVVDIRSFKKIIDNYKDQGYRIAIDDTGSGYSGLKLITEIHPHFIKLDMNLIRDIDKDGLKYALIKTFYDFCLVTDIKLIAEGIETENELNSLIEIGIHYGQGYYIQRPAEKFTGMDSRLIEHIAVRNEKKRELYLNKPAAVFVGDICRKSLSVTSSHTGANILDTFNNNPSLYGLPVVDEGKLSGLIMKDKFYARLGTQYGFALYVNRPVGILMDNRPLTVDYETSIDNVSKMAMARSEENLYDYIVVTKNSKYYGIVTVKDLLEKTTELEVNFARHLNPLTGLPGNMLIEQKLVSVLSENKPFTILYMDIDDFKVYNDIYGFEKGDRVLQYLSEILTGCLAMSGSCNSFIGHIGGDDFIVILESYETDEICKRLIHSFDIGRSGFYSREDIERGFIINRNRRGVEERFGLIGLSIAGICNRNRKYGDIYELAEHSSKIKKKCKEKNGSCYLIE